MAAPASLGEESPRILVFSTITISDPGIDLAGSRHLEYPATVQTMAVPCSSGLKPSWLIHALESGFDGVFIASDGEECSYLPDCAERTAKIISRAQAIMSERGIAPQRLREPRTKHKPRPDREYSDENGNQCLHGQIVHHLRSSIRRLDAVPKSTVVCSNYVKGTATEEKEHRCYRRWHRYFFRAHRPQGISV